MLHRALLVSLVLIPLAGLTAGCASSAPNSAPASAVAPQAKTGVSGFFSSTAETMQKGTHAVVAAFTPAPKQPTTNDPVSLNSKAKAPGPDLFLASARLHESQGDLQGATADYEKGLKAFPGDTQLLLGYGHLKDRQGNLVEATRMYQETVTRHPKEASAYNDLGLCYARRGMMDQAAGSLAKAVELQPDRKLYRNNLATVQVELGQIDAAFAQLSTVHGPAVAHYNLGYLLVQKGNQQAAAAQFQQAVAADPSLVDAQKWLAKLSGTPDSSLAMNRRTPATEVSFAPTIRLNTPTSDARFSEAPVPSASPEYLQAQANSNIRVRYPQQGGEVRSNEQGGIPPSPDSGNIPKPDNSQNQDALKMLPPVNSAYFAPQRY